MIVYGDPQYSITASEAVGRLGAFLSRADSGTVEPAHDIVIALGRIEQAIADSRRDDPIFASLAAILQATDLAASHFISILVGNGFNLERLEAVRSCAFRALPSGDGRMSPHEWINVHGKLLKTDIWGHDCDHTYPGPQSVLWDAAGALIEWQMTAARKTEFLRSLRRKASNSMNESSSFSDSHTAHFASACVRW